MSALTSVGGILPLVLVLVILSVVFDVKARLGRPAGAAVRLEPA